MKSLLIRVYCFRFPLTVLRFFSPCIIFLGFIGCIHYAISGPSQSLDAQQTLRSLVGTRSQSIDEELLRTDPVLYYSLASKNGELRNVEPVIRSLEKLASEARLEKNYPDMIRYLQSLETLGAVTKQDRQEAFVEWIFDIAQNHSPGVAFSMLSDFVVNFSDFDEEQQQFLKELVFDHSVRVPGVIEGIPETCNLSKKDWFKGVVTIWIREGYQVRYGLSFPEWGVGTGFFIDKKGYLLTNYHVIASYVERRSIRSGFKIMIEPAGSHLKSRFPVEIIGYSKMADLALLQAKDYRPELVFSFADESLIQTGDRVYALGSPGGQTETLTGGLISHTHRNLKFMPIGEVIQLDAPVNFGNSGGPLLNENGEITGVIFAKYGGPSFEGMSFALPLKTVRAVLPLLMIAKGKSAKLPFIGIAMAEVTDHVEISLVMRDSLLHTYGISNGMKFCELSGMPIVVRDGIFCDLQRKLMRNFTNTLIKVVFIQDGKSFEVITRLRERSDRPVIDVLKSTPVYELYAPVFGMVLKPLSRNLMYVEKVYTNSEAAILGVKAKDTITIHQTILNVSEDEKSPRGVVGIFRVLLEEDAGMSRNVVLLGSLDADYWL